MLPTANSESCLNLETAIGNDKVMQDLDLESFLTEEEHSRMVKDSSVGRDSRSNGCVNLSFSTAVSRLKKQELIKDLFTSCKTPEGIYKKIIEIGRDAPPFPSEFKLEKNLVPGCQSVMYLHSFLENERVFFLAESEALISRGLATILISVYNGEEPETILSCPPTFLQDLGIHASLSPSRSNGLSSLLLKMKQDALNLITKKTS